MQHTDKEKDLYATDQQLRLKIPTMICDTYNVIVYKDQKQNEYIIEHQIWVVIHNSTGPIKNRLINTMSAMV